MQPHHRVVLSEGNYLLLSAEPWWRLREHVFDEAWYLDCCQEEACRRVLQRQVGNGRDPAAAARRVETNDQPNAEQVAASSARRATLVVPTLPL